eukprot:1138291-Pelagomonas_calceolata.AAC.3
MPSLLPAAFVAKKEGHAHAHSSPDQGCCPGSQEGHVISACQVCWRWGQEEHAGMDTQAKSKAATSGARKGICSQRSHIGCLTHLSQDQAVTLKLGSRLLPWAPQRACRRLSHPQ